MFCNGCANVLTLLSRTDIPDSLVALDVGTEEASKCTFRDFVVVHVGEFQQLTEGDGLPEKAIEQVSHAADVTGGRRGTTAVASSW
jgi:hypothetical protein